MEEVITDEQVLDHLAANIRHFRGERSLSWLARVAGLTPIQVSRIENKANMPGTGMIARIAVALDVSVDQLLACPPGKFDAGG